MVGKLTTHVLDTARGCPAAGISIELWSLDDQSDKKILLKTAVTNADGRTETPLLMGEELCTGVYELIFTVGDYFNQAFRTLPDPAFLNRIPLRFSVADAQSHYHVPLLVSPWSYSTYRGS
jgi:5-hydroxyisourate hydrolase